MLDPYRMIFINIITSVLLLTGMLIYRYVYPKKKVNLFVFLLLIFILPIISISRTGDYESGDFNIHIYRIMSFYDSLMEGHLMPSWAAELNATYGNTLFIFNYSLPYYVISLFHFIGISFINSTKIYLGLTLYLSGIFMYIWIKKLTNNKLSAFTASIFYVFNPYHLIDVHFRATLGESTIFTLVPLLLFFITSYAKERKFIYLPSISIACQLLFLAHPMVAGIFFAISLLFTLSLISIKKNIKDIFLVIASLLLGVFGSIYSWFSFILFSRYVFPNPSGISPQFDTLSQVLYSPWRLGLLFQGPQGEIAPIFGYTQIFVVIIATILLFKNKLSKKLKPKYVFWLFIIFVVILFMTPYSAIFWKQFPLLLMLNSNRLLLPIALGTSVIAGYLAISFSNKKTLVNILLLITIGYTILNWGHRRIIPEIDDNSLRKNVWISTVTEGPTAYFLNNKWADINNFWFTQLPKNHLEIVKGNGTVEQVSRTSVKHTYVVISKTPITIKENTLYFPGWELTANKSDIFIYPGKRGIIHANLPKGKFDLELEYKDISLYKATKILSFGIFLILISALLISFLMYKGRNIELRRFYSKP